MMNRFCKTLAIAALSLGGVMMIGCETQPANPEPTKAPVTTPKEVAKPLNVTYLEVARGNKIFVVGTAESAKRVQAGGMPVSHVAEIGGGKTVYFENKPEGMEAALRAEYAKRHP